MHFCKLSDSTAHPVSLKQRSSYAWKTGDKRDKGDNTWKESVQ